MIEQQSQRVYRVGGLASATGLTVRTLHHYDHVGLVCPSARTSAGHRLYDESDVQRLYEVLALRQAGLSLESIRQALDGKSSLEGLLGEHLAYLDRQLAATRRLRAQLATVLTKLSDAESADVTDFLELIRKVITVDQTVREYFSETQLARLAERREQVGEEAVQEGQQRWRALIDRVEQAVQAGTDPASAEAQGMAREWMELLESFHGGDEGLRDSLYRMQADNAADIQQNYGGPSPEQMEFIKHANQARS